MRFFHPGTRGAFYFVDKSNYLGRGAAELQAAARKPGTTGVTQRQATVASWTSIFSEKNNRQSFYFVVLKGVIFFCLTSVSAEGTLSPIYILYV